MKLTWSRRALALVNPTATMVAYRKSSQSTFQAAEGRGQEELLAVDGAERGELFFFPGKGSDHSQALVDGPLSTSTQATLTRLGGLLKEEDRRGGGKEDKTSEGRRVGGI